MRTVFAGDTPDFLLNIKDENGTIIAADNTALISNIIIVAYSQFDPKKILGRYALDITNYPDHTQLLVENGAVKLILSAEGTSNCVNEEVVAQIRTEFVDATYPSGKKVLTAADVICKIIPYKE
jgi:hypothetical protein